MKILQTIIAFIPSTFGGVKNHLYNQAKEMVKQGHSVEICTSNAFSRTENNGEKGSKYINGIKVVYFRRFFPFPLFFVPMLMPYLRKNICDFEIIHLQDFRTFPNIVAYFFARKHGIPYVLSAGGSVPRGNFPKAVKKWFFDKALGNKMLRNSSGLIALSEVEVEQYQEIGIPNNKIIVVPNAVDPEVIPESLKVGSFKEKHKIKEKYLISFVGRIHEIKGLDFLVKSFAELLKKERSSKLVIAGGNHGYLNHLRSIVAQLGIVDNILFPGFVSGSDKWALYLDSDVFVLPSKSEAFGNVIPEAALCETPIVLSDGCAIANCVKKNGFGIVVPYGDVKELYSALLRVITNDQLRMKMTNNGKKYVLDNWTWEKSTNILLGIYSDILMKKKSTRF